tara:strand:+ start:348 stop:938 length:591 start_codon:yes stop_codon:yes gene_type:complete
MEIIIHRINTVKKLKLIPLKYGTEIDVRSYNNKLILAHAPFIRGDILEDYLKYYNHGTLVVNIKEAGIEQLVIKQLKKFKIKSYFLLDVEFPFIYKSSRKGFKNTSIRFSEEESINTVKKYINRIDWVWIDTFSKLPINKDNINILNKFKKCLVSPDRWNRPHDIKKYIKVMKQKNFFINSVMTSEKMVKVWENNS